nr:hypothetical protein [Tanacetum cinerariifolium]
VALIANTQEIFFSTFHSCFPRLLVYAKSLLFPFVLRYANPIKFSPTNAFGVHVYLLPFVSVYTRFHKVLTHSSSLPKRRVSFPFPFRVNSDQSRSKLSFQASRVFLLPLCRVLAATNKVPS